VGSTAAAFDSSRVHPNDGLPPIGDVGARKGPVEKRCAQSFERLHLRRDDDPMQAEASRA
jgi:hypothetical protein